MQLFEIVHAQTAIWTNVAAATTQKRDTHCVYRILETEDGLKNLMALLLDVGKTGKCSSRFYVFFIICGAWQNSA